MSVLKLISSQNNIRAHNTSTCSGCMAPLVLSFPNQVTDWQSHLAVLQLGASISNGMQACKCTQATPMHLADLNKTAYIISVKNSVYPQITYSACLQKVRRKGYICFVQHSTLESKFYSKISGAICDSECSS